VKIVVHLIRLLDEVKAPLARASIVWVVGEYSDKVNVRSLAGWFVYFRPIFE
jgi:hypothetical protein